MRARLTSIVTIAAVLLGLAPVGDAAATGQGVGDRHEAAPERALVQTGEVDLALQRAVRAAWRPIVAASVGVAVPVAVAEPSVVPGAFIWPAKAPITSGFGRRGPRMHTGVDIDAHYGAPIVAVQDGTVTLAGWKNGYGKTVIIDHGHAVTTLYGHQSRLVVRNGQRVTQGQLLGFVGNTGHVTAPHLHYEVRINDVPRNPMPWLR